MIPDVSFFAFIVVAVIVSLHNPVVGHSVNDWCSKVETVVDDCVIEVQLDLVKSLVRLFILWVRLDEELDDNGALIDCDDLDL
jgi:hypothetical protein